MQKLIVLGEEFMATINENFLKLKAGYLFPEIIRQVLEFQAENPDAEIISLGRGDVTQPLVPAIVQVMKTAVEEMSRQESFRGYGPAKGYDFLVNTIIENDFNARGIDLDKDEVFVSDGAKCDIGNIQEIFGKDNTVAVADPVFPLYVDTNVMAGRTGPVQENGQYDKVVYIPCFAENDFIPDLPQTKVDLIYLCFPNNPTGAVANREILKKWIDYAREQKAVILFDAAYEAYITDPDVMHSIYEIKEAKEVAIEIRSFSKTAGFTGVRCGFTVVPKELKAYKKNGQTVEVNPLWHRRQNTKFNGASYITQAGAAAVYTDEGKRQTREIIDLYMNNAKQIREALIRLGYTVYGGINAPYVWTKTPDSMSSWEFFELLLHKAYVVCTPGEGFGAAGEGYVRLSTFAAPEDVKKAMERFAVI